VLVHRVKEMLAVVEFQVLNMVLVVEVVPELLV
jgi:hypothetical protein